ncbi:zinc ribbon domain-containing protein [Tepidimicrobium xylanilyticum]|uniref:Zinc-ribbon domain-containing protein n=1 Tax=Tepidimicrobium xylanilyticum TaxID=1123352 RepID=A0A1H3ED81_9FIRM|nr:zinc ribbon domain-containing protein [Tepidimicrobium xylanilyticum]SDX76693.1 zinc-ribbon domain-containing protein [Tepidimicrobium xylanilyticum]
MKSVKPGRGPSKMGMVSGIGATLFGIFWCIVAGKMGAWFMIPFGLIFVCMAIYNVIYHHHNATSENRYSIVDIVDGKEERDPLNEKYGKKASANQAIYDQNGIGAAYCPYCGASVDLEFNFCPKCGEKLPN